MTTKSEPPPSTQVRRLRTQGVSYQQIATMYGITVEDAYLLGHTEEVIDLHVAEGQLFNP